VKSNEEKRMEKEKRKKEKKKILVWNEWN